MPIGRKVPLQAQNGAIIPECPTNGAECAAAWEIPAEVASTVTLKINRPLLGTKQMDLLDSMPLTAYDAVDVVRRFGPGTYHLSPGPGPFRRSAATLHASEEYARACGWNVQPPQAAPRASERMASALVERAAHQPTTPDGFAYVMEMAMRPMMERLERMERDRMPAQPQGPGMIEMIGVLSTIQANQAAQQNQMLQLFLPMVTGRPIQIPGVKADEDGDGDELDMIGKATEGLGRGLGGVLKEMLMGGGAPRQAAAAPPAQRMAPRVVNPNPAQVAPLQTKGQPVNTSPITPEQQAELEPFLAKLRPYSAILKAQEPKPAAEVAEWLDGMVDDETAPVVVAFTGLCIRHGEQVLGLIGPEFVSPYWHSVILILGGGIAKEMQEGLEHPEGSE